MNEPYKLIHSSKTNEWYTPAKYIEAARQVMGGIDLDPASHELANQIVKATRFFDSSHNGLLEDWHGRVFLNPPYGKTKNRSNQEIWSTYLIGQYQLGHTTEAILLVNAVTDCKWFKQLWQYPICFTDHRIKFYNQSGEPSRPTHGNCFVYFGLSKAEFKRMFQRFGTIVENITP